MLCKTKLSFRVEMERRRSLSMLQVLIISALVSSRLVCFTGALQSCQQNYEFFSRTGVDQKLSLVDGNCTAGDQTIEPNMGLYIFGQNNMSTAVNSSDVVVKELLQSTLPALKAPPWTHWHFKVEQDALLVLKYVLLEGGGLDISGFADVASCIFHGLGADLSRSGNRAAIIQESGVATFNSSVFRLYKIKSRSGKAALGGAIYIDTSASSAASFRDCFFHNNGAVADANGHAIDLDEQTPPVGRGGAVAVVRGHAIFSSCTFQGNSALNSGGGVAIMDEGHGKFFASSFRGNSVVHVADGTGDTKVLTGGALYIDSSAGVLLSSCNFTKNVVKNFRAATSNPLNVLFFGGGAVSIIRGSVVFQLCFVLENFVSYSGNCGMCVSSVRVGGGGVFMKGGTASMENCVIGENAIITDDDSVLRGGIEMHIIGGQSFLLHHSRLQSSANSHGSLVMLDGVKARLNMSANTTIAQPALTKTTFLVTQRGYAHVLDCQPGYYTMLANGLLPSNLTDFTGCEIPCEVGTFGDRWVLRLKNCPPCPEGSYCPEKKMTRPIECSRGMSTGGATGSKTSENCQGCSSGSYMENSVCLVCPYRTYNPSYNSNCTACPLGTFTFGQGKKAHDDESDCLSCPAGTQYDNDTETCNVCPAGFYALPRTGPGGAFTKCVACEVGRFNPDPSTNPEFHDDISDCFACPEGQFSDARRVYCATCDAGKALQNSTFNCITCDSGQYGDGKRCQMCPAGWSQAKKMLSYCLPCVFGRYAKAAGQAFCRGCEKGYFTDQVNSTECSLCPAGFFTESYRQPSCLKCRSGFYQTERGSERCNPCPRGYYQQRQGQKMCNFTTEENYIAAPDGIGQLRVPDGWYKTNCSKAAVGGREICLGSQVCPAGRYGQRPATSFCNRCPGGYFSLAPGAVKCIECEPGKFSSDTSEAGGGGTRQVFGMCDRRSSLQ